MNSTMRKTKNLLARLVLAAMLVPGAAMAASTSNWPMEPMEPNLQDLPSLQNGWRLYVNYCLGCHSLAYQRYERTADDLGVPHDIALEQLVFTDQKIGEHMTNAMPADLAKEWFGAPPPDLTMVTRTRGEEWLYNYLKTFYIDESRPFGVNNKVFPNVGMPNVLAELQGVQRSDCIQMPKLAANGGEMRDPLTGAHLSVFMLFLDTLLTAHGQNSGFFLIVFFVDLSVCSARHDLSPLYVISIDYLNESAFAYLYNIVDSN